MPYDFRLKKKLFGGLDPNSVTEYIAKIKAENNLLKKELDQAESIDQEEVDTLRSTIEELNSKVKDYEKEIEKLKDTIEDLEDTIDDLEEDKPVLVEGDSPESSSIVVESFNLANHYIRSAVKISSEVSASTIESTEKSKASLAESIETLENFESTIRVVKSQISEVVSKFDDVSEVFEKLKDFGGANLELELEKEKNEKEKEKETKKTRKSKREAKAPLSLVD